MTYIPDLAICTYGRHGQYPSPYEKHYPGSLAIGWLGEGNDYNKDGQLISGFVESLRSLVSKYKHDLSFQWMGYHDCELCPSKKEEKKEPRHANLIIHGKRNTFAVPELLLHYIVDHGYIPPTEFQEATVDYNLKYVAKD